MNIDDFKSGFTENEIPLMWKLIWERQKETGDKYLKIEAKNGLRISEAMPLNLSIPIDQLQMKDLLWRVHEEIAESFEAIEEAYTFTLSSSSESRDRALLHAKEELADGLHFLIEAMYISGLFKNIEDHIVTNTIMDPFNLGAIQGIFKVSGKDYILFDIYTKDRLSEIYFKPSYYLGLVGNTLKNKPWKQTQLMTDVEKTKSLLWLALVDYVNLMLSIMTPIEILDLYFRKNQVNQFRMKSEY